LKEVKEGEANNSSYGLFQGQNTPSVHEKGPQDEMYQIKCTPTHCTIDHL